MHTIGLDPLGQRHVIIDDEGNVAFRADGLQRLRQAGCFVLVQPFHAELESGDGRSIQRAGEPFREVPAHVER
ncbi:hypothetical protein GCM10009127_18520 [Alteraurantiacibacter aestuarii]